MKIAGAHIRGFRAIEDLELDFRDASDKPLDLVVLAGPNGVGKTRILEALLLGCGYKNFSKIKTNPLFDLRINSKDYEICINFPNDTLNDKLSSPDKFQPTDKLDKLTINEHRLLKTSSRHLYGYSGYGGAFGNIPDELIFPPIVYFSSWRKSKLVGSLSVTIGKSGKRLDLTEDNRLGIIKQYLIDLIARRAFEQPAPQTPIQELHPFKTLAQAWSEFYKNQWFEAKAVSVEVDEGFDLYRINGDSGQEIPVDVLSSGEIELLTMLGWFAIQKDFVNGLLFIDEPELHLHPTWQRKILKALKTVLPTTQVICTTHSPQVISEVPPESMFLLKEEAGKVVVFKPESSWGMDTNRILEDLLDTAERPEEIKSELSRLFDLIDRNKLHEAKILVNTLRKLIPHEPELAGAEALIRRREAIGR